MRPRHPVRYALRHGGSLAPTYVVAQIPAVGLQGEGHPPGDADEVLGFEATAARTSTMQQRRNAHAARAFALARWVDPGTVAVTISQVHPARPRWVKYSSHLAEDEHQMP